MGHMKAKWQGIRSTRKQIDIDNDNDEPVLDPPQPHLERAKCHHVACGIIATSELKRNSMHQLARQISIYIRHEQ